MRKHRILYAFLLLLPAVLSLAALAGADNADGGASRVRAAIVNDDQIATTADGTQIPGGRQIIAELTKDPAPAGASLTWEVVSAQSAQSGLDDGAYQAVVTIPADFSQGLASVIEGESTAAPVVTVRTGNGADARAGAINEALVRAAGTQFGGTLTIAYISRAMTGLSQVSDSLSAAADGARKVADGQGEAMGGAAQLASAAGQLDSGLGQLASGAGQLDSGAHQLSANTAAASAGAGQLASGTAQLEGGLGALDSGANDLSGGAARLDAGITAYVQGAGALDANGRTLASGAQSLAGSIDSYIAGVAGVHAGIGQIRGQLGQFDTSGLAGMQTQLQGAAAGAGTLAEGASQIEGLVGACQAGSAEACAGITAAAQQLNQGAAGLRSQLESGASQVGGAAAQLGGGLAQLDGGLEQLSSGMDAGLVGSSADQLSAGAHALAEGVGQMASGLSALDSASPALSDASARVAQGSTALSRAAAIASSASTSLSAGAAELASGTGQLAAGAEDLSGATGVLASGSSELAQGGARMSGAAAQLGQGLGQLQSGADSLADRLGAAAQQVPSYTQDQADESARAISAPVGVDASGQAADAQALWAPTVVALVAWVGALVGVVGAGALSSRSIDSPSSPAQLAWASLSKPLVVSVLAGGAVAGVLALAGVVPAHPLGAVVVAIGVFAAFTVVNQALIGVFGRNGGLIASGAVALVQITTLSAVAPPDSLDGAFAALRPIMPLSAADTVMRWAVLGVGSPTRASWALALWMGASLLVVVAAIAKRRRTSLAELRAEAAVA